MSRLSDKFQTVTVDFTFSIQDVCIVLSITLLVIMVLTTYVAQAGLLCLLLRLFRFSIIIACLYLALCAAVQGLILVISSIISCLYISKSNFLGSSFCGQFIYDKCFCTTSSLGSLCHTTDMYVQINFILILSSKIFDLVSVLYYYGMKRAAYRLSDPHFYQSSKWLQNLW